MSAPDRPLSPTVETLIELIAIAHHKSPEDEGGEGEYGCGWPQVRCPGILRLMASLREALQSRQRNPQLDRLKEAFEALLIAEVQAYGGLPTYTGRCGTEQTALREAIAELLQPRL